MTGTQEIVWGPAIAVDGKRPGWLGEFADRIAYQRNGNRWFGPHPQWPDMWSESDIVGSGSGWGNVTAIRLPADHPHYRQTEAAIPEGMKAWHGGDAAPADWAGLDSDTLLRNGYRVKGGYRWTHKSAAHPDGAAATDIIAYTPKATPQEAPIDWSGELEATDGNGKVWPIKIVDHGEWVEATLPKGFAPVEGHCVDIADDNWGYEKNRNGKANDWLPVLRNVSQPTPQADTKPDVTARMEALVRAMNETGSLHYAKWCDPLFDEARAIVALLPEPVEPDDEVAKQLLDDMGWALGSQPLDGVKPIDIFDTVKAALARGRALALAGEKEA